MSERNNPQDPSTWEGEFAVRACWELWCTRRDQWLRANGKRGSTGKLGTARRATLVRRLEVYGPEEVAHALLGVYCAGLAEPNFWEAMRESEQKQNVPHYAGLYRASTGAAVFSELAAGKLF